MSGILLYEFVGLLELLEKEIYILVENDNRPPFESLSLFLFLAFDDIQKEVTVPVFLHVEKIRPVSICRGGPRGKDLSSDSHIFPLLQNLSPYYTIGNEQSSEEKDLTVVRRFGILPTDFCIASVV
jgi:hypothetical protein